MAKYLSAKTYVVAKQLEAILIKKQFWLLMDSGIVLDAILGTIY